MRPWVLLSVAASLDGYIDDASAQRLLLSNAADFDRVDQIRAESDAILIGARTLRTDNPRLLVNSAERRAARMSAGRPEFPVKVTVTDSGDLDPALRFWHTGGAKLVYTSDAGAAALGDRLDGLADVVSLGERLALPALVADLGTRGIHRLMVEGGTGMHTGFLAADLVDEIRLAIAPILVGDPAAPRFVGPGQFPGGAGRRLHLTGVEQLGDVAVLKYQVSPDPHPRN
ncbi:5-amino-6-(5-phosphoribosylamino)uracil reductase [Nocardia fluminea]|uniref:5-amino-6-(5-phosphoribosylamino)uracil reductase n=1 Tax=Nocardia fluminea TaxID=134984 RepID=A0A2N3VAH2_9NOCA|nr:5-amino-6-(5-phosphoribosylamino)uracil reductase [Nocardia fluminea]